MLKILLEQWDKNNGALREELAKLSGYLEYEDLVKLTFKVIYNRDNEFINNYVYRSLDTENITVIDNGDYQGTLLFMIPFDTYQPSENDYLLTYAGYGSCSGCDTLLSIVDYGNDKYSEAQIKDLLALCKDIVTNTVKPYNYGWRYDSEFDTVDY